MKRLLKVAIVGVFLFLTCSYASAQVTIGADIEPVKAALLDLKTYATRPDSTTSETGGLVLSRVKLVNRTTLQPFIATSDAEWNAANQAKTRLDHIGLIVYNVENDANFHEGLYFWTGADWKPLAVTSPYIYLPAFKLDWNVTTINLYEDVYKENLNPSNSGHYASSVGTGTGSVVAFPDYSSNPTDFYYVVTDYDAAVIKIKSISPEGLMTYEKAGTLLPENAYINVVMIRK
jgi:hypothetical protein